MDNITLGATVAFKTLMDKLQVVFRSRSADPRVRRRARSRAGQLQV